MIHKLRQRFIAIAMASVMAVTLVMGISINAINFYTTNANLNSTLEMISSNQGMIEFLEPMKPGHDKDMHFSPETPFSTRYFVINYTSDGSLVSADLSRIASVKSGNVEQYLSIARERGEGFGYSGNFKYLIEPKDDGGYMAIFLESQKELRALKSFAMASAAVILVCIGLVYVLVLLLSRRAIDPMVKNMEKQKQFVTDASHELKTPLAVITTSMRVLEMELGQNRWIDKIRVQTGKLTRLVNDLVTLSRLDEEKPPLKSSEFDLSAAVLETAESFRESARENGHELELEIKSDLMLTGDEYSVRQLVSILMDNAIKYSDEKSLIKLKLEETKNAILIKTTNPCKNADASELEKYFDRFYRADKARTSQTAGGFGIGLSIARGICEVHHGSIDARLQDGHIEFAASLRK